MERIDWLRCMVGAVAGLLVAVLLMVAVVAFGTGEPGLTMQNWLVVLFAVNAGAGDVTYASLKTLNPLDITVLVLAAATFAGFWPGPGRAQKAWMGVAVALPLVGIAVLLATGLAGRSSLFAAGLVMSCLMLGNRAMRLPAGLGIAAGALLLGGDFATSGSPSPVVAAFVAVGYVLLVAWFLWLALLLLAGSPHPGAGPGEPEPGKSPGAG